MSFKKYILDDVLLRKWIFYFFKVFGVATMTLNGKYLQKNNIQDSSFCSSKQGVVYNIFLMCCTITLNISSMLYMHDTQVFEEAFELTINIIHSVSASFTVVCILIIFSFKQSTTISLADKIETIIEYSEVAANKISKRRKLFWKRIGRVFLINLLTQLLETFTTPISIRAAMYNSMALQTCNSIINAMLIQYMVMLVTIQEVYAIINDCLLSISKKFQHTSTIQTIRNNGKEKELENLSSLRRLCSLLYEISQDISTFYSLPMLLCTFHIFIMLIVGGYYIARPIVLRKSYLPALMHLHTYFYILYFTVSLITLTISVTNTINEVT